MLTVLSGALLSASAVKNGLLYNDFIYAFTTCGFYAAVERLETFEDVGQEAAAIGACLQFVMAGSVFMDKHFAETDGLANVIAALEALRAKTIHPPALELLEVSAFVLSTITLANSPL